jgi:hypothetical protein
MSVDHRSEAITLVVLIACAGWWVLCVGLLDTAKSWRVFRSRREPRGPVTEAPGKPK